MRALGIALLLLAACDEPKRPKVGDKHWEPARVGIRTIAKLASAHRNATGAFPSGTAQVLPVSGTSSEDACCWHPERRCPVSDAWATDPVWSALKFQIREPSEFRYSYESDGTTVKASAIGDWDCDQNMAAITLTMSVVDGAVKTSIVEPANLVE